MGTLVGEADFCTENKLQFGRRVERYPAFVGITRITNIGRSGGGERSVRRFILLVRRFGR